MKKTYYFVLILLTTFSLFTLFPSCNAEEEPESTEDFLSLEVSAAEESDYSGIQKWHITNKKVCVIFGYDFNSPEIITSYKKILGENFGLEEDGGMIVTITYPDDFRHNGKYLVTDLKNFLSDASRDYCAVVILGAPENTHISLARLQDEWNMQLPFPIAALFPQDDVLGLEATCDFVLDRQQSGEMTDEAFSHNDDFIAEKAPLILCQTIDYMTKLGTSLPKDSSVQANILQMLDGENLAHYLDPETGLQSINHFIIY
ncbi:MAG: hypothetical protein K5829_05240 [Treponema sp.]|nr:hypothetical protein [Treponema sp.]